MPNSLLQIATTDAAETLPELTTGQSIAGAIVLSVGMLSLVTVAAAIRQRIAGRPIMETAHRSPLRVPIPVAVLGIALAVFLAVNAISTVRSDNPVTEMVILKGLLAQLESNVMLMIIFGSMIVVCNWPPNWQTNLIPTDEYQPVNPVLTGQQDEHRPVETNPTSNSKQLFNSDEELISLPPDQPLLPPEPWHFSTELKFATIAFLLAYAPSMMCRLVIVKSMEKPKSHPLLEMMNDGGLPYYLLILIAFLAVVLAPLVEELIYRVVIAGGILNRRSPWVAITISSLLFSFSHGFPDSISLLPLAFILGYTYVQRRSYLTVVLVHFLFNAFNMVVAFLSMPAA